MPLPGSHHGKKILVPGSASSLTCPSCSKAGASYSLPGYAHSAHTAYSEIIVGRGIAMNMLDGLSPGGSREKGLIQYPSPGIPYQTANST